jgi:hypothetical protein
MRRFSIGLLAVLALLCQFATAATNTIPVPDFGRLESQLRLKPVQKAQYDIAVEASQRALMSVALAGLQVKERLSQEMAKPQPDLNILYRIHEDVMFIAAPNFRDAKDEWERLYRLLDKRQVDAAKRFLHEQLGAYFLGMI